MGRSGHLKLRGAGANRREFFKRSGSAAWALGAAPLLSLQGAAHAAAANPVFQHGVASGDPLSDRVILWTRVTPPVPKAAVTVDYVIAVDPALSNVLYRGTTKTNASRDYTVKIDALRLQPATTYYYRFMAEGASSPVGRTRTLPVGTASHLRMAVVSCSNFAYGYFNAYRRIAERADLDLVMHLGDYIYEYGSGVYGSLRACEPPTEIVTLADYRARHAQYKRDPDSQAMHRQHPLVAIWDDHETTNDAFRDGAQNHQPATEGVWETRVGDALRAYYEWMPVRPVDTRNLRRNQRSFSYGNLAEVVMLEQRLSARSQQLAATIPTPFGNGFVQAGPFADPARQLLGAEQETWLFDKLRGTPAKWKLLGQGVMFAQLKVQGAPNAQGGGVFLNSDQWDGYQPARDRVYAVLKGSQGHGAVNNVVVLTGDIHSSWAADLTPDPNNPQVASGGYDPASGQGSCAVEFVTTSVSSPGVDSDTSGTIANTLRGINPHFKYINLHKRGYMLLDVTPGRALCEWWHLDTVQSLGANESLAAAFQVADGTNRLAPASPSTPRPNPPALAP
jgi:alkaline phosphatase D